MKKLISVCVDTDVYSTLEKEEPASIFFYSGGAIND